MGKLLTLARGGLGGLGLLAPGRAIAVRPPDTFIVSYPRSGNTWMRFLLGNLVHPQRPLDLRSVEELVPDIYVRAGKHIARLPDPRLLKSHEPFEHRYPNVIYIVRDPRQVVASYHRWHRKTRMIPDDYPVAAYVKRFVTGSVGPYGNWAEHVGSWLGARGDNGRFLLVRYEDLVRSPECVLTDLCRFLGLDRSAPAVEQAVRRSSLSRLRELERTQGSRWATQWGGRPDVPFFGDAELGFSDRDVKPITEAFGAQMRRLGYA